MAESPDTAKRPPGAPYPGGVDPELIALSRPRARVGPVLGVSIIALCVYLIAAMWADLTFSLGGSDPSELAGWTELVEGDHDNAFVSVTAPPDRSFAAQLAAGKTGVGGHRMMPVQGSDDRVWLYTDSNPWSPSAVQYDERYTGRVRRIDDLPFSDTLRAYLAAQSATPRYVEPARVREALGAGADRIEDPAGGVITVQPGAPVAVVATVPGQIELLAMSTDDRPDAASWELALANAGVLAPGERAVGGTEQVFRFLLRTELGLDELRAKLAAAQLFAVTARPVTVRRTATWAELESTAQGLRVRDELAPWDDIVSITVTVRHALPAGAVVVLTDEQPGNYWYVLPLAIVLALFAALFAWGLVRTFRAA